MRFTAAAAPATSKPKRLSLLVLSGLGALQAGMALAAEPPRNHRAMQPPGLYRVDWEAGPEAGRKPHNFCLQQGSSGQDAAARASCPDHVVRVVDAQTLSYVSNCPTAQSTRMVRRIDDKTWTIHTAMKIKVEGAEAVPAGSVKERWTRIAGACKP